MSQKTLLSAITGSIVLMFLSSAGALAQPGDEKHLEQKRQAAEKRAPLKAPPRFACDLVTPDFVVTGSESTGPADEHCFPSDGTGTFGPRSDIPDLLIVDGMDV
ncbi:MAG: hypothetical protein MI919_11490, partial [Holophagales bacterium]|nr:hypothetical protein [Holophagales bacterium]